MRTIIPILLFVIFLFCACNSQPKEEQKEEKNEKEELLNKSTSSEKDEEAKNCDEFIDQYEEWMDNYVKLLEKYMKNPMDAGLMKEYSEVAGESMKWMEQWGKLSYCASKDKYQKRFDEISEKADKKMKELGIE